MKTVGEYLRDASKKCPDTIAIKADGLELTYAELFTQSKILAASLSKRSPRRVGIYCSAAIDYCRALYGALLAGIPAFLLSGDTPPLKAEEIAKRFSLDFIISDQPEKFTESVTVFSSAPKENSPYELPRVNEGQDAVIMLTSGTTGSVRAVPIDHKNIIQTGKAFNDFLGIISPEKEMVLPPLTHSFGFRRLMAQLLVKGTVYAVSGVFNPAEALRTMKRENVTALSAVPSHIRFFLSHFRKNFIAIADSIRYIELSSSSMSAEEKGDLSALLPKAEIVMTYGMTEATRSALLRFKGNQRRLSTVGQPSAGVEHLIYDTEGRELGEGEVGEVAVRGQNVARGYLSGSDSSEGRFVGDNFRTGDLGFFDQDRYLTIVGRKDDIINIGGKKLSPIELELLLLRHYPGLDCAVSHTKDDILGNRAVLCLSGDFEIDKIKKIFLDSCEPYKRPAYIVSLPSIPRTENGKILRKELLEIFERQELEKIPL